MTNELLFDMPLLPHLIMNGLKRYDDRPFIFLGDEVVTYKQVREKTSRFAQALQSKGVQQGARVALISANRAEVLYQIFANMAVGVVYTPLHPMGSLDDHAYVLEDAEVDTLVFDPSLFQERAAQLKGRVPGLKNLLALGPT